MDAENFDELEKFAMNSFEAAIKDNVFIVEEFFNRMEKEFARWGFREESAGGVQNILVIRLDAVGDYILTSPTIRAIRENYPSAHITLIVSKTVYPMAELCPYVNEVFELEQNQDLSETMINNVIRFAKKTLWKRRYDICFYLGIVTRPVKSFLLYLSGARERICFNVNSIDKQLSTKCIKVLPEYYAHDCLTNLYLLKLAGLKVSSTNLEVWYDKTDVLTAKKLMENFAAGRMKIAVGIGAGAPARKYPVEKYLVAFKEIVSRGVALLIFGGPDEVDDAKFLEENLPKESVKNIVALNPTWRVTAALISLTDMYIGNDTGTQHIASTLKKPVIELTRVAADIKEFCKVHDEATSYHPWQTPAIVLKPAHQFEECRAKPHYTGCRADKPHCITQITPFEIIDAFDEMMYFTKNSRVKIVDESSIKTDLFL